jgi:hypothetical protein
MPSDGWQRTESALAAPRVRWLVFAILLGVFVAFRWWQRLEPWNSDDTELFQLSVDAAAGKHWVFGTLPSGSVLTHQAFRIGLLPVAVPVVRLLGASAAAYYLVPLLFACLGFAALYWLLFRQFGALIALTFALIHLLWPYEVQHASVFLSDLPSAASALLSLCLIDAAARSRRWGEVYVLLAALAAVESQLLRNNALVLLAPGLLILLLSQPTRRPALWTSALALLGVLGVQSFLVYRGLGWGADLQRVRSALAEYAPFLPVYSWPAFVLRQFKHQLSTFGRGPSGVLALLLLAASLLGHAWLLLSERRPLLRAIAAVGLFTWLVFSFSIYERLPGGVRAMAPLNARYLQAFAYSSLLVWAWCYSRLRARAGLLRRASAALPVLLLGFALAGSLGHLPPTYRGSSTEQLVQALNARVAQHAQEPALSVVGTAYSLAVPRLFCCGAAVLWRELEPGELAQLPMPSSSTLVLRDVLRELRLAQYLSPEPRATYRRDLARSEERLWLGAKLAYVDGTYALFDASRAPASAADAGKVAVVEPAPLLGAPACQESGAGADGARQLLPRHGGASRGVCEYSWLADARVAPAAGSRVVLRIQTAYELPLSLSLDVVEDGERGISRLGQAQLAPGTAYVPLQLALNARGWYPVYRVAANTSGGPTSSSTDAPDADVVRIWPAEWRALPAR